MKLSQVGGRAERGRGPGFGNVPERTARGAALPFLCQAVSREINDDLFILWDTLIERR
jgi:hypothetical protein